MTLSCIPQQCHVVLSVSTLGKDKKLVVNLPVYNMKMNTAHSVSDYSCYQRGCRELGVLTKILTSNRAGLQKKMTKSYSFDKYTKKCKHRALY